MAEYNETVKSHTLEVNDIVRRYTVRYQVTAGDGDDFLLEKEGTSDAEYGDFRTGTVQSAPGYDLVSIVWEDLNLTAPANAITKYVFRSNVSSTPIKTNDNYLVRWNHDIVCLKKDKADVDAADWTAVTTQAEANAVADGQPRKHNQAQGLGDLNTDDDKIVVALDALKPGVESYLVPNPIVVEHVYTKVSAVVNSQVAKVGTLEAPSETFGLSSGNDYWLVNSVQSEKQGSWWHIITEYQYAADEWDTDIYS